MKTQATAKATFGGFARSTGRRLLLSKRRLLVSRVASMSRSSFEFPARCLTLSTNVEQIAGKLQRSQHQEVPAPVSAPVTGVRLAGTQLSLLTHRPFPPVLDKLKERGGRLIEWLTVSGLTETRSIGPSRVIARGRDSCRPS